MNRYIARYCGNGLPAYFLNAFSISLQVLLCLIIMSPLLYRSTVGKNEDWLFPWMWMTPQILTKLAIVGLVMTLSFGFGSWIIAHHHSRKPASTDPE